MKYFIFVPVETVVPPEVTDVKGYLVPRTSPAWTINGKVYFVMPNIKIKVFTEVEIANEKEQYLPKYSEVLLSFEVTKRKISSYIKQGKNGQTFLKKKRYEKITFSIEDCYLADAPLQPQLTEENINPRHSYIYSAEGVVVVELTKRINGNDPTPEPQLTEENINPMHSYISSAEGVATIELTEKINENNDASSPPNSYFIIAEKKPDTDDPEIGASFKGNALFSKDSEILVCAEAAHAKDVAAKVSGRIVFRFESDQHYVADESGKFKLDYEAIEDINFSVLTKPLYKVQLILSVKEYLKTYKNIIVPERTIMSANKEHDLGARRALAVIAILNGLSGATDLAKDFLTFVVLTHKYSKVGRTGNLRQTVFEHYKDFYFHRGEIQLANVEDSFFNNELSEIFTVFKSKGVATADAKERIKALRNIVGQELEKVTVEDNIISIVDNVNALVKGEYDPAKPICSLDPAFGENAVKNVYGPSAATEKYLQEDKKLSKEDIDAYRNGTKDLNGVSDKGIIRAVNILRWCAKENISPLEKALINFVVLTHEYSFWSYFITGTLRKRVWDDYKMQNPEMKHVELKNLSDYLLENTLGEIMRAFGGNDIKKADAKMRIEAFRTWIGAELEKNTFDLTSGDVRSRINNLLEGTFDSQFSQGLSKVSSIAVLR